MTPGERADRANQLLNDPVFIGVFDDIRLQLVARLEDTAIGDIDMQHEIALTLQLLKKLREQLQNYGNDLRVEQYKRKQDSFIERMRQRIA